MRRTYHFTPWVMTLVFDEFDDRRHTIFVDFKCKRCNVILTFIDCAGGPSIYKPYLGSEWVNTATLEPPLTCEEATMEKALK